MTGSSAFMEQRTQARLCRAQVARCTLGVVYTEGPPFGFVACFYDGPDHGTLYLRVLCVLAGVFVRGATAPIGLIPQGFPTCVSSGKKAVQGGRVIWSRNESGLMIPIVSNVTSEGCDGHHGAKHVSCSQAHKWICLHEWGRGNVGYVFPCQRGTALPFIPLGHSI